MNMNDDVYRLYMKNFYKFRSQIDNEIFKNPQSYGDPTNNILSVKEDRPWIDNIEYIKSEGKVVVTINDQKLLSEFENSLEQNDLDHEIALYINTFIENNEDLIYPENSEMKEAFEMFIQSPYYDRFLIGNQYQIKF
jgi:hypothetical protein